MKQIKALAKRESSLIRELEREYNKEMKDAVKKSALRKMKQVKMAEITLKKLKQELKDLVT